MCNVSLLPPHLLAKVIFSWMPQGEMVRRQRKYTRTCSRAWVRGGWLIGVGTEVDGMGMLPRRECAQWNPAHIHRPHTQENIKWKLFLSFLFMLLTETRRTDGAISFHNIRSPGPSFHRKAANTLLSEKYHKIKSHHGFSFLKARTGTNSTETWDLYRTHAAFHGKKNTPTSGF